MQAESDKNVLLLLQGKKTNKKILVAQQKRPVTPKKRSSPPPPPSPPSPPPPSPPSPPPPTTIELFWKGVKTDKPLVMDAGDSWEHIRYLIEKKENFTDCYVEGYWYDKPHVMIRSSEHLMGGEKILLKRKPCLPGMKLFVPKKFRKEQDAYQVIVHEQQNINDEDFEKMTEEEKMLAICNSVETCTLIEKKVEKKKKPKYWENEDGTISSTYNVYERAGAHPSDYIYKTLPPRPLPHNYKCRRCHQVGTHWEDCCHTWDDPHFVYRKSTF